MGSELMSWQLGWYRLAERISGAFISVVAIGCIAGCFGPGRVTPPKIDAVGAARAAIQQHDRDGDDFISAGELDQAPGLRASRADSNRDGRVTADEIASRINKWQTDRVGLISFVVRITFNDKPLKGAVVEFIPEEFLSGWIEPASGTTDGNGLAFIGMDSTLLRKDLRRTPLMHCGIYRVEVTHPQIQISARYNTKTTLGQEVAADTIESPYTPIALKSQ